MMDSPEWAQNPCYKTPVGLHEHQKEILPQLHAWFKQHTCADVVKRAMAQRLDISIIHSAKELAENECSKPGEIGGAGTVRWREK